MRLKQVWIGVAALLLAFALLIAVHGAIRGTSTGAPSTPAAAFPAKRSQTSGCIASSGLPDPACTPGAVFADVTPAQVCTPGYSQSVRDVTTEERDQVYAEYGIQTHRAGQYEVDHLISLELGGSNDIANLWPEAAVPTPGFHQKDRFENYLHEQMCNGTISLQDAQRQIAQNWLRFWDQAGKP